MYLKPIHWHWLLFFSLFLFVPDSTFADAGDDQFTVAATHYSRGRWRQAAGEFAQFLSDFPTHTRAADAQFFLGEARVQNQQFDLARSHYLKLLADFPNHNHRSQAIYRLGEIAYLAGAQQTAAEYLEKFRQEYANDPLNAFALTYLGEIALATNQLDRAQKVYAEALERFPESSTVENCRFGLGRVLEANGDTAGAERFYQLLMEEPASRLADDAQLQLAIMRYNTGQFEKAITAFEEFDRKFQHSTLSATAVYWRGMSHMKLKQWEEASLAFELALEHFS